MTTNHLHIGPFNEISTHLRAQPKVTVVAQADTSPWFEIQLGDGEGAGIRYRSFFLPPASCGAVAGTLRDVAAKLVLAADELDANNGAFTTIS